MSDIAIIGIGMHPFGRFDDRTGLDMGVMAARQAMSDAGVAWDDIEFAVGGSLSSSMGAGASPDAMVARLGLSGVPFVNVSNGCATAGTALATACASITAGVHDLGLVVGFDKHPRGAFDPDPGILGLGKWYGDTGMMLTTQFFAMKIQRYMYDFGISRGTLAKIAAKAYRNAARNPNAWRRKPWSEEEILASRMLNDPLTQYMFCSPAEGGAAVVVCRADRAREYTDTPVFVKAVTMRTRKFGSFEVMSPWMPVDRASAPTAQAAQLCFDQAGIGPEDIDVIQVQDSEPGAEVMHLSECGFCADGEQEELVARGATEITGPMPVNTDGGLIANGEPIGASGLRQIYEVCLQLRGEAGERQVLDPRVGFTQVYGAPGVSACTILSR
ncbi:MAG TPA: thiolase family protein [Acidimicrobiales bacterium]|nr:thiolase family protein [Acidimicrobiales bacterium]